MNQLVFVLFCLLALGLSVSIAVMEFATWSLMALGVVYFFKQVFLKKTSFRDSLNKLKLGPDWALAIYAIAVVLSVLLMPKTVLSNIEILGFLRWILLLYVLSYLLRGLSETQLRKVLLFLAGGVILAGLYGVFQFLTGVEFFRPHRQVLYPYGNFWRATGFFSQSLTYSYSVGLAGLFLGGWTFLSKANGKSLKLWSLLSLFVGALGVGASLTRGAWLGLAAGLMPYWLMAPKKWRWTSLAAVISILILLFSMSTSLNERLSSIFDLSGSSNHQRVAIWHSNWEIFKDHPWIGVGLTRNSEYLPEYYQKLGYEDVEFVGHAHNNYLQILAGAGIFGFISYVFFTTYFLFLAWRLWRSSEVGGWRRSLGMGAFAAQIFMHVGGLTECNFTDGEVNHMLIFIWALVISQKPR